MSDADGEATETQVWLSIAKDCKYLSVEDQIRLMDGYEEVGRMLGSMMANPDKFFPKYR